ncbi:MAG TPA: hypothetical protein VGI80_01815, partial [Pyrinomonadaceae bacterium]
MRQLLQVLIACVTFVIGTGSVWGVERVVARCFPFAEGVAVREIAATDEIRDSVLADNSDLRVNGVRIGATEKDMLRRLGKPQRIENFDHEAGDPYFREYTYPGLSVGVVGWQGEWTVDSLSIESGPWDINGFSLGASVADVKQI